MSFSSNVKDELAEHISKAKHCHLAELSALYMSCGQVIVKDGEGSEIVFYLENLTVIKKCIILFKKVFHIALEKCERDGRSCLVASLDYGQAMGVIEDLAVDEDMLISDKIVKRDCCKRAFLRGLFLMFGSITDPNRGYHIDITVNTRKQALRVQSLLDAFDLDAKISERKKNFVVYIKDGEKIVDFLNVIGAHVALLEFENVRIVKDVRNNVNRQVNCETANIKKTVSAASKQVADINYIYSTIGFDGLTENLAQIARVRIDNPEMSLKDLGEMLDPPVGKSGVNHRLRKLSEIAKELREKTEENND